MRLLLDTHTLIWCDEGSELRPKTINLIKDAELVYVSAVTGWEIAIKTSVGRVRVRRSVTEVCRASGFVELPVHLRHAEVVATLPWHHRDPFDRFLVAQAIHEKLTLVSRDRIFERYDVPLILV